MKDKKKGWLSLLLILLLIGAVSAVAAIGIGKHHLGSAKNIRLGLDLKGGVSITYEALKKKPSNQEMSDTVHKIQKRVEVHSTEAAVYQEGDKRINVDIPGVTDANEILAALGKAGSIEFKDEAGNVVIDGSDIEDASGETVPDEFGNNEHVVLLTLNGSGTKKFATATKNNIGKTISIVYDGNVISSPTVQTAIENGEARISGQSTIEEARELASTIRIGALPLELTELRSNVVGAKLGLEAMDTSLLAGLIGFILVILFMIAYYRIPGLAASVALVFYVVAVVVTLNVFNVTLTLPGIAGIILSIGMAVDANCIIFSRIREELATGKTVRSAVKIGFDKALSAIVDGNVTTLIAAVVLWFKGSGTVKGFAQTLGIGIILSMFSALVITKIVLTAFYNLGLDDVKHYGLELKLKPFNVVKHKVKYFVLSGILIGTCIAALIINGPVRGAGLNYALDFKGGTSTNVTFNEPITDDLKKDVAKVVSETTGFSPEISEVKGEKSLIIRTMTLDLSKRTALDERLMKDYGVKEESIRTESISATVSNEMQKDAVVAVIIATICMLIYIWIRFKNISFGASAVAALLHDVLTVLMIYAVVYIPVGGTFIACMLTIVGYSINATIVVFDRIREEMALMKKKDSIADVVNQSIIATLTRNINSSLTTFVMVLMLAILGVSSVREFAIPLMAGIVFGTYSSTLVTGPLWYVFKKISLKKAQ